MAIPANCYRVVLSGAMPGGEIWSTGFWVFGAVPGNNSEANVAAELWYSVLNSSDASGSMRIIMAAYARSNVVWQKTTVYCYPSGGPSAAYIGEANHNVAGGSSNALLPNQASVVLSLRTGSAGRRNRGRMYLPLNGLALGTDAQIPAAACDAITATWKALFDDWNGSGDNGVISVVSSTATQHRAVSSLIVDSRIDIQRRRAASQAIAYRSTAALSG